MRLQFYCVFESSHIVTAIVEWQHPLLVLLKFSQVRVIEGQFIPQEPKLLRVIGSSEKSIVREIRGEIIELG